MEAAGIEPAQHSPRLGADSAPALIGVSCGHRVPRVPVADGNARRVYWCPTCGEHRMSGGKTTGLHGHAYLLLLRQLVEDSDTPIVVPDPGTPHGRAVVAALGATVSL